MIRRPPHVCRIGLLAMACLALPAATGCGPAELDADSRQLFDSGHAAFEAGDFAAAERRFTQVIADNPRSATLSELYYFRGLARLRMGRRDAARQDFRRGMEAYGRRRTQLYSAEALADMAYADGDDASAIRLYRQILDNPVEGIPIDQVLFRLGVALQRTGRWAEADEVFARLLSDHEDSPLAADARRHFQATSFTIQVGAFGDRNNAGKLAEKVSRHGLPARVAVIPADARTLHVVRVGRYRTVADAERAAAHLARLGYDALIKP